MLLPVRRDMRVDGHAADRIAHALLYGLRGMMIVAAVGGRPGVTVFGRTRPRLRGSLLRTAASAAGRGFGLVREVGHEISLRGLVTHTV